MVKSPVNLIRPPKNKALVNILINKILPYSAINNNANSPPPYSILNPDTSSDSPSAKSNGARLVSARAEINHIKVTGKMTKRYHIGVWALLCKLKLKFSDNIIALNRTNAILTS